MFTYKTEYLFKTNPIKCSSIKCSSIKCSTFRNQIKIIGAPELLFLKLELPDKCAAKISLKLF